MFDFKRYRAKDMEKIMDSRKLLAPLDLLIVGATGSGKSSSVNAFSSGKENLKKAKIGYGADPMTEKLYSYKLSEYFRIWDTPGLGDGVEEDVNHSKKIISKLRQNIDNPYISYSKIIGFIDLVLVVIEAGIRDMGTVNHLIDNIILPNIDGKRVIIGINQADFAMKGKNFNYEKNIPEPELLQYLEDKKNYIKKRIRDNHRVELPVIYYSAETGYNMNKLMDLIIDNIPSSPRVLESR